MTDSYGRRSPCLRIFFGKCKRFVLVFLGGLLYFFVFGALFLLPLSTKVDALPLSRASKTFKKSSISNLAELFSVKSFCFKISPTLSFIDREGIDRLCAGEQPKNRHYVRYYSGHNMF